MSCAYQYGVETMPQPAAIAKVSAPEAICSRLRYGVTKTSVPDSEITKVVDRQEPVVELDMLGHAELARPPLEHQAVPLAFTPRDVGMGSSGDDVDDLGMPLDHRRQCFDDGLETLPGRDQAERRKHEAAVRARRALRGG